MNAVQDLSTARARRTMEFEDDRRAGAATAQRIVLADTQLLFLDTLAFALRDAGHHVVAVADNCASLRRAIELHDPDVCVTDDNLPDCDVLELVAALRQSQQSCRVVVLTAENDPALMSAALGAGVVGFLHKSRGISVLLDVVRRVADDEVVVEGSFARRKKTEDASATVRRLAGYLTDRERECLTMLVAGLDTRSMAVKLGVAPTTVRSHVQAVLTKLGAHSRLEAASLATRHGLCGDAGPARSSGRDKARTDASADFTTRRRHPSAQ